MMVWFQSSSSAMETPYNACPVRMEDALSHQPVNHFKVPPQHNAMASFI
jgi:hypothetical protein